MKSSNFVKNIISKDKNIFNAELNNLVNSKNIEYLKQLDENSDFIFPFVKEKIIKEFVKLINKENLETVFEYMKYYSSDFEDMIIAPLTNFADEDITDTMLEKLEAGSDDEKAYAAKYFTKIKDTLAIPLLKKEAFSDFYYLKINSARALKGFREKETLDIAKEIIKNSNDEFEKLSALEFIIYYGGEIPFIIEHAFNSQFKENIISDLLNENCFDAVKQMAEDKIEEIFNVLIEAYPENISLNTVKYYEIHKYIKYLLNQKSKYALSLLLIAKSKFEEFLGNENYTFDLDKDTKNELKNIANLLKSVDINEFTVEYNFEKPFEFQACLNVIKEYGKQKDLVELAQIIKNKKIPAYYIVSAMEILHKKGFINLLDEKIADGIENPNLKALAKNFFN